MDRRRFLRTSLAGGLLAAPRSSEGQRAAKVARMNSLSWFSASPEADPHETFRQGLYGAAARASPKRCSRTEFERSRMSS